MRNEALSWKMLVLVSFIFYHPPIESAKTQLICNIIIQKSKGSFLESLLSDKTAFFL